MPMALTTTAVVTFAAEALLLVVHLSVFVVVLNHVLKKTCIFTSAFYKLYLFESIFDGIVFYLVGSLQGQAFTLKR